MRKALITAAAAVLLLPAICSAQSFYSLQNQILDNLELLVLYRAGEVPSTDDDMNMVFDALEDQLPALAGKFSRLEFDGLTKAQGRHIKARALTLLKTARQFKAEGRLVVIQENACDRLLELVGGMAAAGPVIFGTGIAISIITGATDLVIMYLDGFFAYMSIVFILLIVQVGCWVLLG